MATSSANQTHEEQEDVDPAEQSSTGQPNNEHSVDGKKGGEEENRADSESYDEEEEEISSPSVPPSVTMQAEPKLMEISNQIYKKIMFEYHPGWILHFDFHAELGHSLYVFDFTGLDRRIFRCHRKTSTVFQALYYMSHAMYPNLETVRKGQVQINMIDGKTVTRMLLEIHGSYPSNFAQICMYHTPMAVNLMVALAKRSLPKNFLEKLVVGCTFAGRLDQFYGLPTIEAATQRTLNNLNGALRIRYENERTFKL
ncbi:expressed unknown protein [Seminavis robusta]|uniref:Uncharacterized protein n=1 Tax=Seminavis robusta TaxID=568900 RepID=A0A9N8HKV0_9STRA|nr:expressed unknown protein [Seminavis robusta]|eukprot:Sro761_g198590.1 n/a (255) ;mRNA; r:42593-43656